MIMSAVTWPVTVVVTVIVIACTILVSLSLRDADPGQRSTILRAWAQVVRAMRGK
jgi:hypothetical protein